jgi:hypothetical protein
MWRETLKVESGSAGCSTPLQEQSTPSGVLGWHGAYSTADIEGFDRRSESAILYAHRKRSAVMGAAELNEC